MLQCFQNSVAIPLYSLPHHNIFQMEGSFAKETKETKGLVTHSCVTRFLAKKT